MHSNSSNSFDLKKTWFMQWECSVNGDAENLSRM